MRRELFPLYLFLMVLFIGCGPTVRLFSDIDKAASFDRYTTYNFLDFSEGNQKTIPGMELERIRVAFARELESHGLTYSEEDPDVSVRITVYHREAISGVGYWGRYHHMERALSVDMYDNQTMTHIWHCAAVGELEYDAERRAEGLPLLVAKMFERYPVRLMASN